MPIRRRSKSKSTCEIVADDQNTRSPVSHIHFPSAAPSSDLILPRCVENRNFNVQVKAVDRDAKSVFIIHEYVQVQKRPPRFSWREHVECKIQNFHFLRRRVMGKPVVIAAKGVHVIIQYMVCSTSSEMSDQMLHFMYANLGNGHMQVIEDMVNYFPRELILKSGPVQCLFSPDLSCMVLCLPQSYMTDNTSYKLLVADLLKDGDNLVVGRIEDTRFSVKRHKLITFDNARPHHMFIVHIHQYCYKSCIELWDMKEQNCLMHGKCVKTIDPLHLSTSGTTRLSAANSVQIYPAGDRDVTLGQSDLVCSLTGRKLILTCACTMQYDGKLQMRIITIDTSTLDVTSNYCFCLPENLKLLEHKFVAEINDADSEVLISTQKRGAQPEVICSVVLPRHISLKNSCRESILGSCLTNDIQTLPLCRDLLDFLLFK